MYPFLRIRNNWISRISQSRENDSCLLEAFFRRVTWTSFSKSLFEHLKNWELCINEKFFCIRLQKVQSYANASTIFNLSQIQKQWKSELFRCREMYSFFLWKKVHFHLSILLLHTSFSFFLSETKLSHAWGTKIRW